MLRGKKGYEIYTKRRSYQKTALKDLITNIPNGAAELRALFQGKDYFEYPKPTDLLRLLISSVQNQSIVLDFFSGSASTADAVMQLNAVDGGNRKFILVQQKEPCRKNSAASKDGFRTICDVGRERIRRAAAKIHTEHPEAVFDDGFRVYDIIHDRQRGKKGGRHHVD